METTHLEDADGLGPESSISYSGSWEQKGRSLSAAAVLGLLAIGVLYFNGQSILAVIGIVAAEAGGSTVKASGTFVEQLAAAARLHAAPIQIALLVSQYACLLLPTWLLVRWWHTRSVGQYLRLRRVPAIEILLAVLITMAMVPTGTWVANELTRLLKVPEVLLEINAILFTADSLGHFLWLVVVVAITPAICEEIFFRGYVQRTFERAMGARSVVLVGIIFGLFHTQPLSLVTLSLFGILFGFFFFRSRSLLPSMAAHFANNFLAIWLLYKAPEVGEVGLATADRIPLQWILITLPVGLILLYLYNGVTRRTSPA